MPRFEAIEAAGRVTEILSERLFRVEMPNGHQVTAHLGRQMRDQAASLQAGSRVRVEMSPFDMSEGCIVKNNDFET